MAPVLAIYHVTRMQFVGVWMAIAVTVALAWLVVDQLRGRPK